MEGAGDPAVPRPAPGDGPETQPPDRAGRRRRPEITQPTEDHQPTEDSQPLGSLAAKIDRLFRTVRPPGHGGEYTYEQVATTIAERGGPTISASYLYLLRRGLRDNPTKRHLEALGGFFGVPVSYLVDDHDPDQEARLGLMSAVRDPRVHELALSAAALPEEGLELLERVVTLARELEGLRGGGRRRGPCPQGDGPEPEPTADRAVELELVYAQLSLQEGDAEAALERLTGLVERPRLAGHLADQAHWFLAHTHEALGQPEGALPLLLELLSRCLDGSCELPLALIGERVCQFCLDAGDQVLAVHAGQRTLAGLEDRGLAGTREYLRLAATVMLVQAELGQLLHASALAQRLLELAEKVEDRDRQARIYLDCARVAEAAGRWDEAIFLSRRALAEGAAPSDPADAGHRTDLARLRVEAASCLLRGGPDQVMDGVVALEAARGELGERGTPLDRGRWASERAVADLALGQPVAAEVSARRALANLAGMAHPATVEAHLLLGDALRTQGRHAHADAAHEQAGRALAALPAGAGSRAWTAGAWRGLGERWLQRGNVGPAAEALRRALQANGPPCGRPLPHPDGTRPPAVEPVRSAARATPPPCR
jgi:tetratricopeptide (TPR) repeat protein